jgi:hypothetical protein
MGKGKVGIEGLSASVKISRSFAMVQTPGPAEASDFIKSTLSLRLSPVWCFRETRGYLFILSANLSLECDGDGKRTFHTKGP